MKRAIMIIFLTMVLLIAGCAKDGSSDDSGISKSDLKKVDPEFRDMAEAAQEPSPEPTSFQNIFAAYEEGKIDEQRKMMLIILANYAPERLPEKYQGVAKTGRGPIQEATRYMQENWDDLDPDVQEVLYPFHVPPDDPDSYFNQDSADKETILDDLEIIPGVDAAGPTQKQMEVSISSTEKARIYYADNSSHGQKAEWVKEALLKAWPLERDLIGKKPTEKVYVYLKPMGSDYGQEWSEDRDDKFRCIVEIGDKYDKKTTQSTTAHELFHCFQDQVPVVFNGTRKWLMEATATWSEHYVYPDYNSEWEYAGGFFTHTGDDMVKFDGTWEYETYLFYLFVTQYLDSPVEVKDVLYRAKNMQGREAATVMANFDFMWKEFALWTWNRVPKEKYQDIPSFPRPKLPDKRLSYPNGGSLDFSPLSDKKVYDEAWYVDPLAMTYNVRTFSDDIDKVVYQFPDEGDDKHKRQALILIGDVWTEEDWTYIKERKFCRTRPDEKVRGIVLIGSNSEPTGSGYTQSFKIDTRGKCAPEWRGTTTWTWMMSSSETIPKNFLSGETSIKYRQYAMYISHDTLMYDEENDEFLVKDQFVTYRHSEHETITYAQDCGPLGRTGTLELAGSAYHHWDVDEDALWQSDAPDRLRASDDDAWEYEVDLDIGAQVSDFISSYDYSTRTYKNCPLAGIMTPNEADGTSVQTFSGRTGFFKNSPNDITARMSEDGKRITADTTVIEGVAGKDVPMRVTVDYSYG